MNTAEVRYDLHGAVSVDWRKLEAFNRKNDAKFPRDLTEWELTQWQYAFANEIVRLVWVTDCGDDLSEESPAEERAE